MWAGIMDGTVTGMQVMTSWQAAMYRVFLENNITVNENNELVSSARMSATSTRRTIAEGKAAILGPKDVSVSVSNSYSNDFENLSTGLANNSSSLPSYTTPVLKKLRAKAKTRKFSFRDLDSGTGRNNSRSSGAAAKLNLVASQKPLSRERGP